MADSPDPSAFSPPAAPAFAVPADGFFAALGAHYRIVRPLGSGGMATVYLADDLRHGRQVAIKVLHPEIITDAVSTRRFLREIEIAARLTHPNILPLHDSGEIEGQPFFVMPFVDGRTLRDQIRESGSLPAADAFRIAGQVADALDYAHKNGVVHRDVKPENILIAAGHAVVADFGIARAIDAATGDQLTSARFAIGTPAYMSPEQALPGSVIDGRSDEYSLAVVVHEMLTGHTPPPLAARRSLGSLRALKDGHAIPPRADRAIRRALTLDPEERFATASDFARALQSRSPVRAWHVIAAGLVVAAAWASTLLRKPESSAPVASRRVVVAPFQNQTGDPSLDYLGQMGAYWVTEGLLGTGVVQVVPTPSAVPAASFAVAQQGSAAGAGLVKTLAAETGADIVVSGAFYRERDTIAVQVQVTDASGSSPSLLGAVGPVRGSASTPVAVIEAVRSRVMGLLAAELDPRISAFATTPRQPPTIDAYREFSSGLDDYVNLRFLPAGGRFASAYRRDTSFVAAALLSSISYSNVGQYRVADSLLDVIAAKRSQLSEYDQHWFDYRREFLRGNRPAALHEIRAIASAVPGTKATYNLAVEALQNGYLHEAWTHIESLSPDRGPMRGWPSYWEVVSTIAHALGAREEMARGQEARRRFPDLPFAMRPILRAYAAAGNTAAVMALLDTAQRGRQDSTISVAELALEGGMELSAHGSSDGARSAFRRGLAWLDAHAGRSRRSSDRLMRGRLLYEGGNWPRARAIADSLVAIAPANADYLGMSGAAAARMGDSAMAQRRFNQLEALPRRYSFGAASVNEARILAVRGQRDSAVALVRRAFEEGRAFGPWMHREADFALLRSYGPFAELMKSKD